MGSNDSVLSSLDGKSPTLFLVGGASLVGYATLLGAGLFLDTSYSFVREVILGPAGYVLGFLALLGLYPVLVDRNPKLARVGAVFAALGAVGWFGIFLLSPLLGVVLNFVLKPVGVPLEEGRIIIVSWFALAHLAIGSALMSGNDSTGRAEPLAAEV